MDDADEFVKQLEGPRHERIDYMAEFSQGDAVMDEGGEEECGLPRLGGGYARERERPRPLGGAGGRGETKRMWMCVRACVRECEWERGKEHARNE